MSAPWPNKPVTAYLRDLQQADWRVRRQAVAALDALGDRRAVGPVIARLADGESAVRANAARALGKLGDAQAVEPLLAALRDPAPAVRAQAVEALWLLGDPRAVAPVVMMLRDPDQLVRYWAARALLHPHPTVRGRPPLLGPGDESLRAEASAVLFDLATQWRASAKEPRQSPPP